MKFLNNLKLKPVLLIICALISLALALYFFNVQNLLKEFLAWIDTLGPIAPVFFIAAYIVATVLFIPASVLTLGAGLVFGMVLGTLYVSIAATLGATAAFLVGRYIARAWVAKKIEKSEKFRAIDQAVAKEGWKIVGLTRLSPIFPFTLLNYAYGVTQVSLRDYFFASWIGMLPGTIMYVYIGSLAGNLANLGGESHAKSPAQWVFYAVGLLATIAVTMYVTQIAKKALKSHITYQDNQ